MPSRCAATAPCVTAVANGEKPYGVLVDFMAFNAKAKGSPIDFIFPGRRHCRR